VPLNEVVNVRHKPSLISPVKTNSQEIVNWHSITESEDRELREEHTLHQCFNAIEVKLRANRVLSEQNAGALHSAANRRLESEKKHVELFGASLFVVATAYPTERQ
jgi:hypothetical protein